MAQRQGGAQSPQRSGEVLQSLAVLLLQRFANTNEALSLPFKQHSHVGSRLEIPAPKATGDGGLPFLLTEGGRSPTGVSKNGANS